MSSDVHVEVGGEKGTAVAEGLIKLLKRINFPTSFNEVGVNDEDKERILKAAKNPQLWTKLEQAPVSLISRNANGNIDAKQTEENINTYMGALIDAIRTGDFARVKNISVEERK